MNDQYPLEDQVCGNCAHCEQELNLTLPVKGRRANAGPETRTWHVCAVAALEPDISGAVALVSAWSHCRDYADAWKPSEDYLNDVDARAAAEECAADRDKDNGVIPGVDCPGTLGGYGYRSLHLPRSPHAA